MAVKQPAFKFDLGDLVEDVVTGYRGIVLCRSEWLNACRRYTLQAPMKKKDTKPPDAHGIDEDNGKLIKPAVVADKAVKPTGGDQPLPTRAPDPRR